MLNIDVASHSFWQFARLWKNGERANFQMYCESGVLEMSFSAKIGHPDHLHFPPPPPPPFFTRKTPSQLRRKEHRQKEAEKAKSDKNEIENEYSEDESDDTEASHHESLKESEITFKPNEQSHQNATFKCDKCQSLFSCISYLNEHMREKHRIFKCKYCEFTSSSDVGIQKHKDSHGFYCDHCRKLFKYEDHFIDHMRAHKEKSLHIT